MMILTTAGRMATLSWMIYRATGVGVHAVVATGIAVACLSGIAHGFACGLEQQVSVTLHHATGCSAAQGWLAFDEGDLTVFEILGDQPGCALWTRYFPRRGARTATLRWAMLCSSGAVADTALLLTVRAFVKAPTTITGRVDVSVDSALRACGASLRVIPVQCE